MLVGSSVNSWQNEVRCRSVRQANGSATVEMSASETRGAATVVLGILDAVSRSASVRICEANGHGTTAREGSATASLHATNKASTCRLTSSISLVSTQLNAVLVYRETGLPVLCCCWHTEVWENTHA